LELGNSAVKEVAGSVVHDKDKIISSQLGILGRIRSFGLSFVLEIKYGAGETPNYVFLNDLWILPVDELNWIASEIIELLRGKQENRDLGKLIFLPQLENSDLGFAFGFRLFGPAGRGLPMVLACRLSTPSSLGS
jgi:hypothetical protein